MDTRGKFDATVPPYTGMQVFDATRTSSGTCGTVPARAGLLLRRETYDHPYPHCWRCGNPLIQRAVTRGSCR